MDTRTKTGTITVMPTADNPTTAPGTALPAELDPPVPGLETSGTDDSGHASTGGPRRAQTRRGRRALLLTVATVTLITVNVAARAGAYYVAVPGPATNLTAATTGTVTNPEFGRHGQMLLTTVTLKRPTWWQYLRARALPDQDTTLIPAGTSDPAAVTAATATAADQMHDAKTTAWAVATAHVHGGDTTGLGATVLTVTPGTPAERAGVHPLDVITAVNGTPVLSAHALPGMTAVAPLHSTLTVRRDGHPLTLTATFTTGDNGQRLGVQLGTAVPDEITPGLSVRTGDVGGPSGGLMFALTFTDALAAGDLTGGLAIAGTGTLAADGTVGVISGVADKVAGALAAGATVFFTPIANAAEAAAAAPARMTVVPVATYQDALTWLCAHGATSTACR